MDENASLGERIFVTVFTMIVCGLLMWGLRLIFEGSELYGYIAGALILMVVFAIAFRIDASDRRKLAEENAARAADGDRRPLNASVADPEVLPPPHRSSARPATD